MATKYLRLSGEIMWANNLVQADDKFPTNDGAKIYRANVKLDDASVEAVEQAGIRVKSKEGVYTFRRPEFKTMKSEQVTFGPPKLTGFPDDHLSVGNGSKVTVDVIAYDSKFGVGHRLEGVTLVELVKYVRPEASVDLPV